jgi:flavin reductase (DIM6/NTAB) family NADH-FMN oxidoreductase RutF
MQLKTSDMSSLDVYRTLTQTIIPRPIAWILTDSGEKSYNLAPFSYFNVVHSDPALVMVSIGRRDNGERKDTRANIVRNKQCVIHIADSSMAEAVTKSSLPVEFGESEVELGGHEVIHDLELTDLPRLKNSKVAFACELDQEIAVGKDKKHGMLLLLVKEIYIADEICTKTNDRLKVDAQKLDPLGRLGGNDYALFGEIKTVARPEYQP